MERVLVIGASGYLGQKLCRTFVDAGYDVTGVARRKPVTEYPFKYIQWDAGPGDIDELLAALAGNEPQYIVCALGSVNYRQDFRAAQREHIAPSKTIITFGERLMELGFLKKMVWVSSVAAMGWYNRPESRMGLSEGDDRYQSGLSVYADVKRVSEELFSAAALRAGIPYVIVRPGSLVGPAESGRRTTTIGLMEKTLRGSPLLCGGASYTSAAQVCQGIVSALRSPESGVYILAGENMTMAEFASLVRDRAISLGIRSYFRFSPILPTWIAFVLGQFGIALSRQQALLGTRYNWFTSALAERDLGYNHTRKSLTDAIDEVLRDIAVPGN